MSSTHAELVEYIRLILDSIPEISDRGTIHTYPRDIDDIYKFDEEFTAEAATGEILVHAWIIRREAIDQVRQAAFNQLAKGQEFRFHTYGVLGFHTLNDEMETEGIFQGILTKILDAFTPAIQIPQTTYPTRPVEAMDRVRVRSISYGDLSGHQVHTAELEILFRERIRNIGYYGMT